MSAEPGNKDENDDAAGATDRNVCKVRKQLSLPGFEDGVGQVWVLPGGRWHAELFGGWWVCVAATRKAAVEGVVRAYEEERERY